MALRGELLHGSVEFPLDGSTKMMATIEVIDDQLGRIGLRQIPVDDTQTIGAVRTFIEQLLPALEAQIGIPVTFPIIAPLSADPDATP